MRRTSGILVALVAAILSLALASQAFAVTTTEDGSATSQETQVALKEINLTGKFLAKEEHIRIQPHTHCQWFAHFTNSDTLIGEYHGQKFIGYPDVHGYLCRDKYSPTGWVKRGGGHTGRDCGNIAAPPHKHVPFKVVKFSQIVEPNTKVQVHVTVHSMAVLHLSCGEAKGEGSAEDWIWITYNVLVKAEGNGGVRTEVAGSLVAKAQDEASSKATLHCSTTTEPGPPPPPPPSSFTATATASASASATATVSCPPGSEYGSATASAFAEASATATATSSVSQQDANEKAQADAQAKANAAAQAAAEATAKAEAKAECRPEKEKKHEEKTYEATATATASASATATATVSCPPGDESATATATATASASASATASATSKISQADAQAKAEAAAWAKAEANAEAKAKAEAKAQAEAKASVKCKAAPIPPSIEFYNEPKHVYTTDTITLCVVATAPNGHGVSVKFKARTGRGTTSPTFQEPGYSNLYCTVYTAPSTEGYDKVTATATDTSTGLSESVSTMEFPNPNGETGEEGSGF